MIARRLLPAAFAVLALASSVRACLWDRDTLQMERKRFPGTNELITGRFVRHSRAYYEWRVADRLDYLMAYPKSPEAIDDLAVAYDKLGRQAEGIAVLEKCIAEHPDRYETVANLGTLLIHAGELDRGAELIERAIRINPDAHFGREKYQLLLVRYVQQSELKTKGVLSTASRRNNHSYRAVGFASYVLEQAKLPVALTFDEAHQDPPSDSRLAMKQELDAAQKGLLGILHFGNFESPVVLEALGDLLILLGQGQDDARLLAARAYLKAATHSKGSYASAELEKMAREALDAHEEYHDDPPERSTIPLAAKLREEVAAANEWFRQIIDDEAAWIRQGVDVDRAFSAKYYDSLDRTIDEAAKRVASEPVDDRDRRNLWIMVRVIGTLAAVFVAGCAALAAGIVGFLKWRDAKRTSAAAVRDQ